MPINPMILEQIRTNDPSLTDLCLKDNKIDAQGAEALADALKVNTSLMSLDLSDNKIYGSGIKAIAEALKVNTSLTILDLSANEIYGSGAKALAEALKANTSLTSLDLSDNQIYASGTNALAEALKVNTTLTSLDLKFNEIGDGGTKELADALKVNASLTSLDLWGNKIGDEGAKALAEVLLINASLTNLNLWGNQIGFAGAKALADTFKINITLTRINLCANQVDYIITEMNFYTLYRNINISFLLKDSIKNACMRSIATHSIEALQGAFLEINKEFYSKINHFHIRDAFDRLNKAIFGLRFSDDKSEVELIEVVFERLREYLSSLILNLDTLPDTAYPSEFARWLSARVNAKNLGDAEAQVMALAALAQPFHDEDLREEAKPELIGLLNNRYLSNLSEGSVQRRTLDLLTIDLACQHPYERDLMGFALAAYSRLSGGGKITFDQVMNQLNDRKTVQADFEKLLTNECECKHWTRSVLREKCLEVLTQEFSPAPPRSLSPNPHGLFQPFVASASPVAEVKAPQNK